MLHSIQTLVQQDVAVEDVLHPLEQVKAVGQIVLAQGSPLQQVVVPPQPSSQLSVPYEQPVAVAFGVHESQQVVVPPQPSSQLTVPYKQPVAAAFGVQLGAL